MNIETYTPVSIGTGETLSPISDFFIKDKQLFRIDPEKFQNLLLTKNKIAFFSEYVSKSINKSKTGTSVDLQNFIKNVLNESPENIAKKVIPYPNRETGNEQILCCYTSNGLPVIPGSSIKGAIKTALFYNWLIDTTDGRSTLNDYIDKVISEQHNNKNRLNQFTRDFLGKFEECYKRHYLDLSIGDSKPFSSNALVIYKTERLHLTKPRSNNVPQVKTCIKKGFSSDIDIKLPQINQENPISQINVFAYNSLVTEYDILEKESINLPEKIKIKLNNFYDKTIKEIKQAYETNKATFFIRIGSGKSFFDNSIAMAIYEKDKDSFKVFCEKYELGKPPKGQRSKKTEIFPVTRSIISNIYEPMGWVKITLK